MFISGKQIDAAVFNRETVGCCCVHQRDSWMLLCSSKRQVDALVLIIETGYSVVYTSKIKE